MTSNIVKAFEFNNEIMYRRSSDGYWNATAMCKAAGKRWNNFSRNDWTKEYVVALEAITQKRATELVQVVQGGTPEEQGTWVHEVVAIRLAQWLSPEIAAKVDVCLYMLKKQYAKSHELLQEQEQLNLNGIPLIPKGEVELAFRIKNWIDLCCDGGRFYIEHPIVNTINQQAKTRRIDFIKSNGRNVVAYELKLNKITPSDIAESIGSKGYYQLCKDKFNRPVNFIFLSPVGITVEAQLLLDKMTSDISFKTTQDLCYEYYVKGINKKWKHSKWYLDAQVNDDKFRCLFNPEFLSTVNVKQLKVA